jgi:hypothetical protein
MSHALEGIRQLSSSLTARHRASGHTLQGECKQMNSINPKMVLVPLLLTALCACGGLEEGAADEGPPQQVEAVVDGSESASGSEATEEVQAEDSYSTLAYNGACGSGYVLLTSRSLAGGTVYLTYNASAGKNCVVTVRSNPGSRIEMCAKVSKAGKPWIQDCDAYTTYAGPVYVDARGVCIDWGGSIGSSSYYGYGVYCG